MLPFHLNPLNSQSFLQASLQQQYLNYQNYQAMMNFHIQNPMLLANRDLMAQSQLQLVMKMKAQHLSSLAKTQQDLQNFAPINLNCNSQMSETTSLSGSKTLDKSIHFSYNSPLCQGSEVNKLDCDIKASKKPKKADKSLIKNMIIKLLDTLGRNDQDAVNALRAQYASSPSLLLVFDAIVVKYLPVRKHREDIVRYIIRRAFKYFKAGIIKKDKVHGKKAYAILCKKYFEANYEELQKAGVDTADEKELIEVLLPYRKNSKNRTMNTNFTSEIFSSKEFCADYEQFLEKFESFLKQDNEEKIMKLVTIAQECMTKDCVKKIRTYKRLPWLQAWVEKTRLIAYSLPKFGILDSKEDGILKKEEENSGANDETSQEVYGKRLKTETTSGSDSESSDVKSEFS